MAEAVPEKPLPLAEVRLPDARSLPLKFCLPGQRLFTSSEVEDEELKQYSLQGIEKIDRVEVSIEQTPEKENAANASSGEVIAENADETLASKAITENTGETTDAAPAVEEVSAVEATNDQTTEEQDTEVQEVEEPEIKIETAPADFRFPTTNQTRHCFTRYIEYHRCVAAKGEDAPECNKFAKYYRSLCPSEWVERWNEQRQNGTFPGPL